MRKFIVALAVGMLALATPAMAGMRHGGGHGGAFRGGGFHRSAGFGGGHRYGGGWRNGYGYGGDPCYPYAPIISRILCQ